MIVVTVTDGKVSEDASQSGSSGDSLISSESNTVSVDNQTGKIAAVLVFCIITLISYFIFSDAEDPKLNWANYLGSALACGIISLATAAMFLGFLLFLGMLTVPKGRRMLHVITSHLAWPMIVAGVFWMWRAHEGVFEKYVLEQRAHDSAEQQKDKLIFEKKARSAIFKVQTKEEESIRDYLRKSDSPIDVKGWSAVSIRGSKWLVQFEYSVGKQSRWILYEYDEYLGSVKSVLDDEKLLSVYMTKDSDGHPQWNEDISWEIREWYGPIK